MSTDFIDAYRVEAEELLAEMEQCALSLKAEGISEAVDGDTINRIFRAIHTIKGSGSMVGLEGVPEFSHHLETLLEQVREGTVPVSRDLVEILLASADYIRHLLSGEEGGFNAPDNKKAGLLERMRIVLATGLPRVPAQTVRPEDSLRRVGTPVLLPRESTVRVPSERLDRLVGLVAELVMNQLRLTQAASKVKAAELTNPVQEMERLVAELREDVLSLGMLPIGSLFERFRRLLHDLSEELGKETELVVEGAATELDKSILDRLGEPLLHLLRNSIDHGIESPAERLQKGKAPRGLIRLSAVHEGSHVVIEIEDDGRGIDKTAVRARAVGKGIITEDASLTQQDLLNLVFLPGFSTARQVTAVSGRGVGMDVVKRQIDALRGTLLVDSEEGRGTRISISLPLTLAIIDGLLVQVDDDHFVIPISAVVENIDLPRGKGPGREQRNAVAIGEEMIPAIDLHDAFATHPASEPAPFQRAVIVRHGEQRVAFIVDSILGAYPAVIRPSGAFLRGVDLVSGATMMGNGGVALILDIPAVIRYANQQTMQPEWTGGLERAGNGQRPK